MLRVTKLLISLALLLAAPCCFSRKHEVREAKRISEFTYDGGGLYFGAGYHLYRLDLASRSTETLFTTDRILVEQPIIADGAAYFGGRSYVDSKGKRGEDHGFLAVDCQTSKLKWNTRIDGHGGWPQRTRLL